MSDLVQHLAHVMADLHPGWQVPGNAAAIHQARHVASSPYELAVACIEFTKRDDLRTPALLKEPGPHWSTGRTPGARVKPTKCTVAGHEYEDAATCRLCPVERYEPTTAPTLGVLSEAQRAVNARGLALIRATVRDEREAGR